MRRTIWERFLECTLKILSHSWLSILDEWHHSPSWGWFSKEKDEWMSNLAGLTPLHPFPCKEMETWVGIGYHINCLAFSNLIMWGFKTGVIMMGRVSCCYPLRTQGSLETGRCINQKLTGVTKFELENRFQLEILHC